MVQEISCAEGLGVKMNRVTGFAIILVAWAVLSGVSPARAFPDRARHVFVIIMENESFGNIVNSPDAPFFNSLTGGHLNNYWGVAHPSLPNYVAMMGAAPPLPVSDDPRVRIRGDSFPEEMFRHGHTVKAYMQGLPRPGFGGKGYPPVLNRYVLKHDPLLLFSRIRHHKDWRMQARPFSQFSTDLSGGRVPEVSLIVPDLCHDMHGAFLCHFRNRHDLIRAGDKFLSTWVPAILQSKEYQEGSSWIFILWDEGDTYVGHVDPDSAKDKDGPVNGRISSGGRLPFLWISGNPPRGWKTDCFSNHYSLLETLTRNFGLPELAPPGERIPLPVMGASCRR